jgi:CubicO group peptidase (beta-lactamase class C family)
MTRITAGAIFFVLLVASSQPAIDTSGQQGSAGFSDQRLQRIHTVVQRNIENGLFPGAVTLVARNGKIANFEAHGQMNLESKMQMRKDALFHLASMTKPITAVAILILVEEGKVRLTDPVSRFIPEFKEIKVAVQKEGETEPRLIAPDREITILDLLTHTSGLGSKSFGPFELVKILQTLKPEATIAGVMPRLASMPLDFQPGSMWRYSSNAAFDVLGDVVEVASGRTFDQFLRERIFEPLGMRDTFFVLPEDRRSRLVPKYQWSDGKWKRVEIPAELFGKSYFSGAAGLVSSTEDYFRFAQMLLDRGACNGNTIISPRSVELLSSNFVGEMFGGQLGRPKGMGFGLGVEVVLNAAQAAVYRPEGSFGWDGSFGTYFWVDPHRGLVAIFMIQAIKNPGRTPHNDFDTAIMQSLIDNDRTKPDSNSQLK